MVSKGTAVILIVRVATLFGAVYIFCEIAEICTLTIPIKHLSCNNWGPEEKKR